MTAMRNHCQLLGLILWALGSAAGAEKPNLIVVFSDDHGWPDIGAAGVYVFSRIRRREKS